ncbi:MAG: SGNH/GDSL hydrolase family protein [Tannerellaceae bacterium]|nr:SGNH/GDSL hydrolase family protein [Tannerellaceae bacterium]
MKNRFFILVMAGCFLLNVDSFAQSVRQTISILGDSYSTFLGYVTPDTNACWYGIPDIEEINDVRMVEETWWYQLIQEQEGQLEVNNSYSGATICHTGYNHEDYSDRSFITRMDHLGNPGIIFIFGGTNDSWAGVPIGEYQYANWTTEDLYKFRPAFCYLLHAMSSRYPDTKIYNITNTELSQEVSDSMDEICRYYEIPNIRLRYIDKQAGHPSVNGMKNICRQVREALLAE